MEGRAIWDTPSPIRTASSTTATCTPFSLPSAGIIQLDRDGESLITLASNAIFRPRCTSTVSLEQADVSSPSSLYDLRDPFYASTLPQCFALAATTVIAYMLVIMLFITPRTFLSGGTVILGRSGGFTNGNGSSRGIGIGGRPWLQKVAALTVAISLTIATANTFRVAEEQYEMGHSDAKALQNEVLNGTELKVIRVISDTFLWLAQAQTLIRLFPRHREKVIIKWTAFALIVLDLIFSLLNNFVYGANNSKPHTFEDAIPALSYLFQLALGLLYCAWVVYYSITKKTYAFYHPHMRNICLVALLSIISVVVPVVFFVLDISKPSLAGWGDYVRWVGAAAASVVVWEWVERIEALERNDKKDGVLGREIFDGDEMLEVTPSFDIDTDRRRRGDGGGNDGSSTAAAGNSWPAMSGLSNRYKPRNSEPRRGGGEPNDSRGRILGRQTGSLQPSSWPLRPPPAATPISRTDTASAESTIYAIRYHPISESRGTIEENPVPSLPRLGGSLDIEAQHDPNILDTIEAEKAMAKVVLSTPTVNRHPRMNMWESLQRAYPFRRNVQNPPREVSAHTLKVERGSEHEARSNKWGVLGKLEDFAAIQADKLRERARPIHATAPLPVTRIPAPPRGRSLQEITEEVQVDQAHRLSQPVSQPIVEETPINPTDPTSGDAPVAAVSRNPYTPADLGTSTVTHRGSLSFVASVQGALERRMAEAAVSLPPLMDEDGNTSRSPTGGSFQRSSSIYSQQPDIARLPVMRIPAPPRRPPTVE